MPNAMMTATRVRDLDGFSGTAALYRLSPPMSVGYYDDDPHAEATEYVVASAAVVPFSGPETYLFAADADGNVTSWLELRGSRKGVLDHAAALEGAGYTITMEVAP